MSRPGKWSTNAIETATDFIGPMAAFVAGVFCGSFMVWMLVARQLPELCEAEEPVLTPARPATTP